MIALRTRRRLTNAAFVAATALATAVALAALGFILWSLLRQGLDLRACLGHRVSPSSVSSKSSRKVTIASVAGRSRSSTAVAAASASPASTALATAR